MAADRTVKLSSIGYIEVIVLYPFLAFRLPLSKGVKKFTS